eukprot:CAMPEP_0197188864 /NCGR_PEP_ID=MMETSP1423-20130617/18647_1 /TAXON_ID=476441 /ORGANISM="Pseudo-nitzschia heimii, Strain UNC1101" /LENGTH=633 /DNA_ID=CAMNT_0042640829 /DNA_START=18 /DNA_END=1919 /DNA_ORIENTATION=+
METKEGKDYDKLVDNVEKLMEEEDYARAASEAEKVVDEVEPAIPAVAKAALLQAMALMTNAMNEMAESGEKPPLELFGKVWNALELSHKLDPENNETTDEMAEVAALLKDLPPPDPPAEVASADVDVLVVGAGAAGVGTGLILTETFGLDRERVLLVERGEEVGETFRRWPEEMKFISPSFNQQGWTNTFDLNSISNGSSPAFSLHAEHPSGIEYAAYLAAIAKTRDLNIRKQTEVVSVKSIGTEELPLFSVDVRSSADENADVETLKARYIVWAAGEFQYPRSTSTTSASNDCADGEEKKCDDGPSEEKKGLPGAELCLHNSEVRSWARVPGDEFIVIGGYESGVDATVHLSRAGKSCRVLASTPTWSIKTIDPSDELAPFTAGRLREVLAPGFKTPPKLYAPLRVESVAKAANGGFDVTAKWLKGEDSPHAPLRELVQNAPEESVGEEGTTLVLNTPNPPILCTGFEGSVAARASHLFEFAPEDDVHEHDHDDHDHDEEGVDTEMGDDQEKGEGDDENMEEKEDGEDEGDDDEEMVHEGGQKKGCLAGAPLLTENDESTIVPGVFLVGPTVSHGSHSFCFVYKFRQRFAIVANAICEGLGRDTKLAVKECRKANMFLDDLSCCEDTCGDVC